MIVFTIIDKDGGTDILKSSRTKLTVGGAYTDDITLLGGDIPPEHGVFHIKDTEVAYTDNGFGTLVNDRKIEGESISLVLEDTVLIGEFAITCTPERGDGVPAYDLSLNESSFGKSDLKHPAEPTKPLTGMPSIPKEDPSRPVSAPEEEPPEMLSPSDKSYYRMYSIPTSDIKDIMEHLDVDMLIPNAEEEYIPDPEEDDEFEQSEKSDDYMRFIMVIIFGIFYLFLSVIFDSCR